VSYVPPVYVNGYEVVASALDKTSETAQFVVVCDWPHAEYDRYAVWTVAYIAGRIEGWQGFYTGDYYVALAYMARRASGGLQ
jgi:hypothetical protein